VIRMLAEQGYCAQLVCYLAKVAYKNNRHLAPVNQQEASTGDEGLGCKPGIKGVSQAKPKRKAVMAFRPDFQHLPLLLLMKFQLIGVCLRPA